MRTEEKDSFSEYFGLLDWEIKNLREANREGEGTGIKEAEITLQVAPKFNG